MPEEPGAGLGASFVASNRGLQAAEGGEPAAPQGAQDNHARETEGGQKADEDHSRDVTGDPDYGRGHAVP